MTVGGLCEIDPTKEHKALGSNWNLEQDTFIMKVSKVVEFTRSLEPTKRNVLRIAAKLFDPLGFISPVMVMLRMLLQELYLSKREWDNTISQHHRSLLQKWLPDLEKVNNVSVSCYYFPGEKRKVKFPSLHRFGDAFKGGYCAVVYLCIETDDWHRTNPAVPKTLVTPSTPMTISRL